MQPRVHSFFFASLLACSFVSLGSAATRETVNLDGVWNFATDPDNRGEKDSWFAPDAKLPAMPLAGYAPEANGTIRVPGIWDNQGYGTETDKVRHNFVGKGWYQRRVDVPSDWNGRRLFLVITGASRYTKVWVNGHFLGEHIGFLSVQERDITDYVTPGKPATIVIQVDSRQRWQVDALYGACTLADFMDIPWGGIWGHVRLEARSDAWLGDLFVQPDVAKSSCSASATVGGKAAGADAARLEVFDQGGRRVAEATVACGAGVSPAPRSEGRKGTGTSPEPDSRGKTHSGSEPVPFLRPSVSVEATIPDAKLWTPDSPTLYTARLSLMKGDQILDTVETRFGMRQFAIDGPYILLNGKRLMLRGYGDDHIYPEQMAMPSDKELHLARLRLIKSYGFNHVRHHSTIMPPEYYEACDELGIISTAEFPICYNQFLPGVGSKWLEAVPKGTDPAPALDTYRREWTAVVRQYRNHPSILCWVMGNELGQYDNLPKPRALFFDIARQNDPTRFFLDSDGVADSVLHDRKLDRDMLDFYMIQFNEPGADPVTDPNKFRCERPIKPALSHEAGNYVTFSRPDLVDQFRHNVKPFWLTDGKARLEKLGLREESSQWAEKSERLYLLLHKYNIESLRKNPYLSGYHWWLFQDYWTSSNGIVDHYFRPKSIKPNDVLKFNNDVVLLQDGLERTYRGKTRLRLKLLVSNFSMGPLSGTLHWNVAAGGHAVAQGQQSLDPAAPQGELIDAGKIDVELPDVAAPAALTVSLELTAVGRRITNDWTSRLYPAAIQPATLPVPVFADDLYVKEFPHWGLKPIPSDGKLSDRAVYLTNSPYDPRLFDALKWGASLVVLDGADQLAKSFTATFRTSWWKAGDSPQANNAGTFVYDNPVTRAMAPDGWCDDGWFYLIEGGKKFEFEAAPARPEILVRALPGMAMVRDSALLFAIGVEKGTMLVSGLNHRKAAGRPENEWLVARLVERAAQFPRPRATWPASTLSVASLAPDGCVPGFRRVVANDGEDAAWYSYREDNARTLVCRQKTTGNAVTWQTAPVSKEPAGDRVTFVFAGGLGFASQPKTEGFALDINGKETLRFDVPGPTTWTSADKRVELRFDSRRAVYVDRLGLFHLTVPRDMLTPGEPCVLRVRSLGTGSQRWFGLNPYF